MPEAERPCHQVVLDSAMYLHKINSPLFRNISPVMSSVITGSSIGAVRLSGGNVTREGRVEVRRNGTWQSVCANQWQWLASNLVCKSMNMGYALAWYTDSLYQGGGSLRVSPPLLCTPDAGNFSNCFELIPPSPANCTAEDDEVGVVCSGSGLGGHARMFELREQHTCTHLMA